MKSLLNVPPASAAEEQPYTLSGVFPWTSRSFVLRLLRMAKRVSNQKVANGLVAVSSAAVLAVYAAGYTRTRSADEAEGQTAERRSSSPRQARNAPVATERTTETSGNPTNSTPKAERARTNAVRDEAGKPELLASVRPLESNLPPAQPQPGGTPTAPETTTAAEHKAEVAVAAPAVEHKTEAVAAVNPAPPPPPPPATPPNPNAPPWKDGTYDGWGSCRHGDIQATVVIQGGRIMSAAIKECDTRYSCDVIDRLIPQVAQRQSVDVDTVSGATQSGDAFSNAVFEALAKAK